VVFAVKRSLAEFAVKAEVCSMGIDREAACAGNSIFAGY
jgi:hypothetical protein